MNNPININTLLKKQNKSSNFGFENDSVLIDSVALVAKSYLAKNWKVIPVAYQSKACHQKNWQNCILQENDIPTVFAKQSNIGVLLGASELTDVDVDSAQAYSFLHWLPPTEARWGRASNPNSHHLYLGIASTRQFKNSEGVIIEIRSQGCYAIMPPSIHPDGESYIWESKGKPGQSNDLEHAVTKIAIAATCLPYWKQGSRHSLALSLSGVLLKADWSVDEVIDVILAIAKVTGDNELADRKKAVLDTADNIKNNISASGITKLIEIIGDKDGSAIGSWVNVKPNSLGDLAGKAKSVIHKRNVAEKVREDLSSRGVFYRTSGSADLLYFHKSERELYSLGSIEFRALCGELYCINGKEPSWGYIIEHLHSYCLRHGELTEFYQFARFQSGKLYIHAGGQKVLRLNGMTIDTIDNGDDGVLFERNMSLAPINPDFTFEGSPVKDYLVNVANAVDIDRLALYEIYIYSLFFESILPTKPIVLFTGPKGSGKTSAGRSLKRALYGSETNVDTGLTSKEDAFWAAICHNYLVCIDNVDTLVTWLADALATVATGGTFKRRKLYETNTLVEYLPRCFTMITSRNPQSFTRDDVVDRLLLVEVKRRSDFIPESQLLSQLDKKHDQIWGELVTNLNKMILELAIPVEKESLSHRLADWARLAILFAPLLGIKNIKDKLKAMETSKVGFALEDQPLAQGLDEWITNNPQHDFIASGELYHQICLMYEAKGQKFDIKSVTQFGGYLKNLRPELETLFKISEKAGPSNKKLFKFSKIITSTLGKSIACFESELADKL